MRRSDLSKLCAVTVAAMTCCLVSPAAAQSEHPFRKFSKPHPEPIEHKHTLRTWAPTVIDLDSTEGFAKKPRIGAIGRIQRLITFSPAAHPPLRIPPPHVTGEGEALNIRGLRAAPVRVAVPGEFGTNRRMFDELVANVEKARTTKEANTVIPRSSNELILKADDQFHVFERPESGAEWKRVKPMLARDFIARALRADALELTAPSATVVPVLVVGDDLHVIGAMGSEAVSTRAQKVALAKQLAGQPVVLSVPKFQGAEGRRRARALVNDLQLIDSNLRIFVDDPDTGVAARVAEASRRKVSDSINVVIPTGEFGVVDGGALQDLSGMLLKSGITVTRVSPEQTTFPTNSSLIVIAGHSADELRRYVATLISKGAFKNNVVVFGSCGTPLTAELRQEIRGAGATALYAFENTITDVDVQRLLKSIVTARKTKSTDDLVGHVIRWGVSQNIHGAWEALRQVAKRDAHG